MVLWYTLLYFLIGLVMNIMLFVSADFRTLTDNKYQCPKVFVRLFVTMDVLGPTNFGIGYLLIEFITRRLQPVVTEYTYSRQQYRVKVVTFNSNCLKGLILLMDILHIILVFAATALSNN